MRRVIWQEGWRITKNEKSEPHYRESLESRPMYPTMVDGLTWHNNREWTKAHYLLATTPQQSGFYNYNLLLVGLTM